MIVVNKIDAIDDSDFDARMSAFKKSFGRKKKPEIMAISAAGRLGIGELISAIERNFLALEQEDKNAENKSDSQSVGELS